MAFQYYNEHFDGHFNLGGAPLVLTLPGLNNSGPGHWQSRWEATRRDCQRVDLGDWSKPWRTEWVRRLDLAIVQADRPVMLVAHSLGCLAVAWWAAHAHRDDLALVKGALLVAPPDVDFFPLDERVESFAPTPHLALPFRSILVASQNDPWMGIHASRRLAKVWGCDFVDAGRAGHINADSMLGDWREGQALLDQLIEQSRVSRPHVIAEPSRQAALTS